MLRNKCLRDRLAFIESIRQAALESDQTDVIKEWCSQQVEHTLASYVTADVSDVPVLVSLACENGIQTISQVYAFYCIAPRTNVSNFPCSRPINEMVREKAFDFLMALVRGLHQSRAQLLAKTAVHCAEGNDPQSHAAHLLDGFIRRSLDSASKPWYMVTSARVLNAIKLCFVTGQTNICQVFLDSAWNTSGEVIQKFDSIYTPLVPPLCGLLTEMNIDICTAPFNNFLHLLISHYLHHVLGSKGQTNLQLRKINCFCSDCSALNEFILGTEPQHSFHFIQKTKGHLESQLIGARDLVTYVPIRSGRSQYMVVKKIDPAILAARRWERRLQETKNLFSTIGMKNVEKIMGDRYADVCKALEGQRGFPLNTVVAQPQNVPGQAATGPALMAGTIVIGEKRKRT